MGSGLDDQGLNGSPPPAMRLMLVKQTAICPSILVIGDIEIMTIPTDGICALALQFD